MRQANNYTEIAIEDPAPGNVVIHLNRVTFPDFYRGMLLPARLRAVGWQEHLRHLREVSRRPGRLRRSLGITLQTQN
jgi:uncharacterized protein (TIGR02265 family)